MKAWLKKFWIFPVLIAAIIAGFAVTEYRYTHPAEPEYCVLCERNYVFRAPVLLNLATGEIAEMEVYSYNPFMPDGIDKTDTGHVRMSHVAGVNVIADAGRSASVILPDKPERMDYSLYCRSCRALLSEAGTRGYVILDLHDPDTMIAYPTTEGTVCTINGYTASVEKKTIRAIPEGHVEVLQVYVTGDE